MPPRSTPTARQERLGAELRKLREAAGVTARDAAALLGSGSTQMSHIEAGRFGISEDRIRRLAGHYACDDHQLVDALVTMANERSKGWWEEFRGVVGPMSLDLAELEHHATSLRALQVIHIPGILQTEDHMRTVFRYNSPDLPPRDLDAHIEFRMRRKDVLQDSPFDAIVHEAALRIKVGGAKVARAQLEHVLEMSERDKVTVRVIPFDVDDFAGTGYSILYAGGSVPQLDTVHIDTAHGVIFVDAEAQLRRYRSLFQRIEASVLSVAESRKLIHRIARDLRKA
ncbi:helix-turn-helix domain-containing protein [Streptomyces pathocidini]|uniref:Helix-turn-helix domain-containing protein n=1 Tax=Streptomyces pathocidini TaxID=1650571 RepID=A0ABW7UXL9_9ACTN|nr:helix-turn-helix transcriptional regulator [Streptomyces pathocidini]